MKKPSLRKYLLGMAAGFGAIALGIAFFFLLYRFDGVRRGAAALTAILMPFIYGGAIAYLLKPFCNWCEGLLTAHLPAKARRAAPPLAVAASLVFGLLVVYALCLMIIPQLIGSILALSSSLPAQLDGLADWLGRLFEDDPALYRFLDQTYDTLSDEFAAWLRTSVAPSLRQIVSGVGVGVLNGVTVLKNLLIGVIAAVYFLAGRKKFAAQAKLILYSALKPRWADLVLEEVRFVDRTFGGFITGKIIDSAIIGALCYLVCVLVPFPNALLVSVIIGVTNIIPFFGPFIGAVPATLLILIVDPVKALWFVLFILILQQLDGNVIGPKILGNTTGLSSFWVLFSILLFGGLWGFAGMIVGVPLFAVLYDLVRKGTLWGLARKGQDARLAAYHDAFCPPPDPAERREKDP